MRDRVCKRNGDRETLPRAHSRNERRPSDPRGYVWQVTHIQSGRGINYRISAHHQLRCGMGPVGTGSRGIPFILRPA